MMWDGRLHMRAMHAVAMQKLAAVGLPGDSAQTTNPNSPVPAKISPARGPSIGKYDPRTDTISRAMRANPDSPWPVRQIGKGMHTKPAQSAIQGAGKALNAAAAPVAKVWDAASAAGTKYVGTPLRTAIYKAQGAPAAGIPERIARNSDAKEWQNSIAGARVKFPAYVGGGHMNVSPYDVAFLAAPGGAAMRGTRLAASVGRVAGRVAGKVLPRVPARHVGRYLAASGLADLSASTYAGTVARAGEVLSGETRANLGARR